MQYRSIIPFHQLRDFCWDNCCLWDENLWKPFVEELEYQYYIFCDEMEKQNKEWNAVILEQSYLNGRNALPCSSNSTRVLEDDPDKQDMLIRATSLIYAAIQIYQNGVPQQYEKEFALEMEQFRNFFGVNRVAGISKDHIHRSIKDILSFAVVYRGYVFIVEIENDYSSAQIYEALQTIVAKYQTQCCYPIGALTALNRSEWACWQIELNKEQQNLSNFTKIHDALFMVCLDQNSPDSLIEAVPLVRDQNFYNRYFDKSLQIIVFANGKAGIHYEHTVIDGSVTSYFSSHLYHMAKNLQITKTEQQNLIIEELSWSICDEKKFLQDFAVVEQRSQVLSLYSHTKIYNKISAEFFSQKNITADSCLQILWQMALYSTFHYHISIEETVHLRHFKGGRYDTFLCVNAESRKFVEMYFGNDYRKPEIWMQFLKAIGEHKSKIKDTKRGKISLKLLRFLLQNSLEHIKQTPDFYQAIYPPVCTTHSGWLPGSAITAFADVENKIGIVYTLKDDSLIVHIRTSGVYCDKLTKLFQQLDKCIENFIDFVCYHH